MNKKLIIGIVAGVVALALIVTGIIVVVKGIDIFNPGNKDTSSPDSSISSDVSDKTDSSSNPLNEDKLTSGVNSATEKDDTLTSDIIKVPVKITKNPGVMAGMISFEYDASAISCVGYENDGEIMQLLIEPQYAAGKVTVIMEAPGIEDTKETGTILTLLFKAKKDAKAGDYEIKIGDDTEFSNYNEQLVEPTIVAEKITVK